MNKVALAIAVKTPESGASKTRLSPPLSAEECAAISACFIRDVSCTIASVAAKDDATTYALYTPRGSEARLSLLLPDGMKLLPQADGDLGARIHQGIVDLLAAGHCGAILVNSDSPTLPVSILRQAVDAVRTSDNVVLSPAADGGYMLIGLSKPHARLFEDIPWSTDAVYRLTRERAREIGVSVIDVPGWYDVDDAASLRLLEDELAGVRPYFATLQGTDAPATRAFIVARQTARPS